MPRVFSPEELCKLLKDQKFGPEDQNATSHVKFTHPIRRPGIPNEAIKKFLG